MNVTYDLHIHSCLSPCGDDDMTPANIAGMAALKGVDVIAVTDHNSCKNCPAVLHYAEELGILAIPGMELCTLEEVHAVCLFPSLLKAMEFDHYVESRLVPFPNNEEIFGRQLIYNKEDSIVGSVENLLINATEISFDGLWELVCSYGGIMFPAHLDKNANSLLSNLGFVPPDSRFTAAEVINAKGLPDLVRQNPYLENCLILHNSDAHQLWNIKEQGMPLCVEEKSVSGVIASLLKGI